MFNYEEVVSVCRIPWFVFVLLTVCRTAQFDLFGNNFQQFNIVSKYFIWTSSNTIKYCDAIMTYLHYLQNINSGCLKSESLFRKCLYHFQTCIVPSNWKCYSCNISCHIIHITWMFLKHHGLRCSKIVWKMFYYVPHYLTMLRYVVKMQNLNLHDRYTTNDIYQ